MNDVVVAIGNSYKDFKVVYDIIGSIITFMLAYKIVYWIIGFFFTKKFKPAKNKHKYAIMISARNEENVIGNLLDSINRQDYPKELITVFVVADNCTDNTAKIAREHGAICYERFNEEKKTKGFALEYLCENIEKDYGIMSFEGYFIFDADNLLKNDYISRMNDSFDAGSPVTTSYRNTKNFSENWIASTYALHWLRSIRCNHRARSVLGLATNIQGTGFLFINKVIKDGWHYTSLTEDRALTADLVAAGYPISYNNDAMFFDEQPVKLKIALRQRLRWSRGHLEAFVETGPYLFMNIFFGKLFVKSSWKDKLPKSKKKKGFKGICLSIVESIRHRFASFDTLMQLTPFSVINIVKWIIVPLFMYSCFSYGYGIKDISLFAGGTELAKLLRRIFDIKINLLPGINAFYLTLLLTIWLRILYRIGKYIENIWAAVYVFIMERKKIIKIPLSKKILYCLTWPTFDIIGRYTTYVAVFKKVTWKTIPHESKVTITDLEKHQ